MALDIQKIKALQPELDRRAQVEQQENWSKSLLNFLLDGDMIEKLHNEKSRKFTTESKRVIGHWVKEGVISGKQESEGGWYYFNRIESIWIDIVSQLREFGLSLPKIKFIREDLFKEVVSGFRLIDQALMLSILNNPQALIIRSKAPLIVCSLKNYQESLYDKIAPHILVNLGPIVENAFPESNFEFKESKGVAGLTIEELKLLYFIRTGEYNEIKVTMKGGEIYLIESSRTESINKKIIDIINQANYQNIEIKIQDGKIVHIKSKQQSKR